jgi:hypothetical protein
MGIMTAEAAVPGGPTSEDIDYAAMALDPGQLAELVGERGECVFTWTTREGDPVGVTVAAALVAGHGRIVAEFFDTGYSRALAWARRPQAATLVAGLADPDRGWDAIVIGEYERAFTAASTR